MSESPIPAFIFAMSSTQITLLTSGILAALAAFYILPKTYPGSSLADYIDSTWLFTRPCIAHFKDDAINVTARCDYRTSSRTAKLCDRCQQAFQQNAAFTAVNQLPRTPVPNTNTLRIEAAPATDTVPPPKIKYESTSNLACPNIYDHKIVGKDNMHTTWMFS